METGWIKLHRKIKKNNLWLKKPSTWTKIFIYILTEVNHETGEGFFNFTQDRKNIGCDITPDIIKKCIATLRQMKILSTTRSTRGMVVKVLNYASYQTVPSKTSTSPSTTEAREKHDRSTTINKKVRSKEDKKDNTTGFLVSYFFKLRSWAYKKREDSTPEEYQKQQILFRRYLSPAKELLFLCDNDLEEAKKCLDIVSKWAKSRELDWSIETVFKKWYDIDKLQPKEKKPYYEGNRAFQIGNKWFILMPNGDKKEFTGNTNQFILK